MLYFAIRLVVALVLGALIGLERQFSRQMAGIRTNALVALGACLFCLVSFQAAGEGDAFRIAAAVVTGIGFLGGGVIVRDGFTIKGLTTAATMWCTSAVGVAVAIGYVAEAAIATGLILLTNLVMRPLSQRVRSLAAIRPTRAFGYHVVVASEAALAAQLRAALGQIAEGSRLLLKSLDEMPGVADGTRRFSLIFQSDHADNTEVERVLALVLAQPGVVSAAWDTVEEGETM
jgi:putative Mg2+ transporter-C (MgtC) family protein